MSDQNTIDAIADIFTSKQTEIRNGKEYSNECFNCGESKAAIQYSQRIKDPLYCGIVDDSGECQVEYDRHRFVRTLKQKEAEDAAELAYAQQMGDMADFMSREQS